MAQELTQDIKRMQEAIYELDVIIGALNFHQHPLKGTLRLNFLIEMNISGWPVLAQGKKRIDAAFPKLFPKSEANETVFNVTALTEAYHKYKREYVKHVSFTPEGESLSKYLCIR